jgi:transcription elongation factor GreA
MDLDYTIVGSTESDPLNAKISNESPIGIALIGAKPGQTVNVTTPGGEIQLRILSIRGNRKTGAKAKVK